MGWVYRPTASTAHAAAHAPHGGGPHVLDRDQPHQGVEAPPVDREVSVRALGHLAHVRLRRVVQVERQLVQVDVELTGKLPPGVRSEQSVDGTIEIERLPDVIYTGRPTYVQPNSTITLFKIVDDGVTVSA